MSSPGESPNNLLGMEGAQSVHSGAVNQIHAPLKLDTGTLAAGGNGLVGAMIQSGVGVPVVGSPAGGLYFRTDTPTVSNQRVYICSVAGVAGAATWVGIL